MAKEPHARRERSLQRLRHHLEDEVDRDLDRYFGAGKTRRRQEERRREQYARRAERLFERMLHGELRDPLLEGLILEGADLGPSVLTFRVLLPEDRRGEDLREIERVLAGCRGRLRSALAQHLPRKRVPVVRVFVFEDGGGGR